MCKPMENLGKIIAIRFPLATTFIFLISGAVCHAQFEASTCALINDLPDDFYSLNNYGLSVNPLTWSPGHTYTVSIEGTYPILPPGGAEPACPDVRVSAWEWPNYPAPDPSGPPDSYVNLSNLNVISPTLTTFTASVADGAPLGIFQLDLSAFPGGWFLWTVQIQPPAPPNPPSSPSQPECGTITLAPVSAAAPATASTPAIPSTPISPSTWVAGVNTPIIIKGSGFTSQTTASCIATQVSVTEGTGPTSIEPVPLSEVKIVDSTTITAVVTPPASETAPPPAVKAVGKPMITAAAASAANDPTETATVTLIGTFYGEGANAASTTVQVENLKAVITDTSNIQDLIVKVMLSAPSGTKGDLNLNLDGSDTNGLELSQIPFTALAPGTQDLKLPFDNSVLPGIYTIANGLWYATVPGLTDAQSVTVPDYTLPKEWTYFRKIFYSLYNKPHEDECSAAEANAWIVDENCNFNMIQLKSDFIKAAWLQGIGVPSDRDLGTLRNAWSLHLGDQGSGQHCAGKYPPGAIGSGEFPGNTFVAGGSLTGSCNKQLVPDQSVAMPCQKVGSQCAASNLSNVKALSCFDNLNLDSGNYTTASRRIVLDKCPACGVTTSINGSDGHIDAFSSSTACSGRAVGNLGLFYTSYPTK
jgi:hypothetical protein